MGDDSLDEIGELRDLLSQPSYLAGCLLDRIRELEPTEPRFQVPFLLASALVTLLKDVPVSAAA